MNEHELFDKLMEEVDALEHAIQYKIENMCPLRGVKTKIEYLKNLRAELDRVDLKQELGHLEYREQLILENVNEEDLDLWLELRWARAKVEELEEQVQDSIEDDAKELLYELDEVQQEQERLETILAII